MSMGIKYAMNKKAKGGEAGVNKPAYEGEKGKELGHSEAGNHVRNMRYSNRSPHDPKASGAMAKRAHQKTLSELHEMKKGDRKNLAEGGDVCSACDAGTCTAHGGLVDKIMRKRMSEGGQVANDTDMTADTQPNEFDDLVLDDDLESDYTGANSGDELGNDAMDENDRDLISRIMRSRAKKDSMPRPA